MMKYLYLIIIGVAMSIPVNAQVIDTRVEMAIRKFLTAESAIMQLYVDTVNPTKLTEDAIRGMLNNLDPHSSYANAEETKKMNEPLEGNFDGIGIQFNVLEDTLMVIQSVAGGPSEKVGIQAGDRILAVNDTVISGVKFAQLEMVKKLRGKKGTKVKLTILRRGVKEPLVFIVTRDKIPTFSINAAYMLTPTVGYVRLESFTATSHKELIEALTKLKAKGMQHLVMDLQSNGGGYLESATDIANEFLEEGDMIVYTNGRKNNATNYRAKGGGMFTKGNLIVLVNEFSASAAEILSGAIQDQDRGIIVGRRTFGKGLVQRPIPLPDGSLIRLTTSHYYTPSGRCIQKPYKKGENEAYNADVLYRFNNGEMTNADSIHFADSLKYKTLRRGRTVYGGGGIMPDYFVPLDTTHYTTYHRTLSNRNVILFTGLKYIDEQRKKLHADYPTFAAFKANYQVPLSLLETLKANGEKDKLTPKDDAEWQASLPLLSLTLKALIARDLWDLSEYFEIINADNAAVQKALEVLQIGTND